LTIRQDTLIEDLEEDVGNVLNKVSVVALLSSDFTYWVGLLNLVEDNNGIGSPTNGFSQLATPKAESAGYIISSPQLTPRSPQNQL
jgi:hypothetical protein